MVQIRAQEPREGCTLVAGAVERHDVDDLARGAAKGDGITCRLAVQASLDRV